MFRVYVENIYIDVDVDKSVDMHCMQFIKINILDLSKTNREMDQQFVPSLYVISLEIETHPIL